MEQNSLVSVVMPVYNVEKYLAEAVDSVLRQTYDAWELILVDDGSTDTSGEMCDSYANKDCRIRAIHQDNAGLSGARNTGMANAKGEYLLFVDSDDYISNTALQDMIETAREEKADCILFEMAQFDDLSKETKIYAQYKEEDFRGNRQAVNILRKLLQTQEYQAMACGYMINCKLLKNIHLSFQRGILHEDELFTLQYMLQCETIALVDHTCYYYRVRENSIMYDKKNIAQKGNSLLFIISQLIELYKIYGDDDIRKECLDLRLRHMYMRVMALYFDGGLKTQIKMNSQMKECMKQILDLDREWSRDKEVQTTCKKYGWIGLKTDLKYRISKRNG